MTKPTPAFSFEDAMAELEAITRTFETETPNLDTGLAKFERGMELVGQLQEHLQTVENRVEMIRARFDAGPQARTDRVTVEDTTDDPFDDPFDVEGTDLTA